MDTNLNKRKIEVVDITDADDDAYNPSPFRAQARVRATAAAAAVPNTQAAYEDEVLAHDENNIDPDEELEQYGLLEMKVVGCRYYNGIATVGEQVLIKREPTNQYDHNAIRVENVSGAQIGHFPRWLATCFAPLIDDGSVKLEGVINGKKGAYEMPLLVAIFTPASPARKDAIIRKIEMKAIPNLRVTRYAMGMVESPAGLPGPSTSTTGIVAAGRAPPLLGLPGSHLPLIVGVGDVFQTAETQAMSEETLEKLPMAVQPERLKTGLLAYQLQGLAWLLQKEHPRLPTSSKEIVQMWTVAGGRKKFYQNIATKYTTNAEPPLASGGALADDMGLGKTLQMIALMVTDPASEKKLLPRPLNMEGSTAGTLIVAPLSVMSNWVTQIAQHVSKNSPLKVYVYHGPGRTRINLGDYDVVITSYGTLTSEFNTKNGHLRSFLWRRIILDEAHQIRNPKSKSSLAVSALEAKSRWCLTGTPIINNLKDLYPLVRFLRYSGGLSDLNIYNSVITRAMRRDLPGDKERLQALITALCLRRTKAMSFVNLRLPRISKTICAISFTKEEKKVYDLLAKEASGLLRKYVIDESGKEVYRFILELLLRMRQVCNHWKLCRSRIEGLQRLAGKDVVDLTPENKAALQDLLQIAIDSQEECSICLDTLHDPRITLCKHVFDLECIAKVIEVQQKCPLCRAVLPNLESTLIEPAAEKENVEAFDEDEEKNHIGSKLEALLKILNNNRNTDPTVKTVIFSQWTSYLDLIEPQLRAHNFKFSRIDGNMRPRARDDAVEALNNDPACTILLASLAVASVGLNLTAASQVVLCDSWWAPAIEDQAIDRVYRLGQKRECTVWRLVVEGTIEQRVLEIQERKRSLVKTAFADKKKDTRESRIAELKVLLS